MAEKSNQDKFIYCPVCEGRGTKALGTDCTDCDGMGLGGFFYNRFFYWGPKLGRAMIELNNLRLKFHLGLNIATFGFGLAGLFALGYWVYRTFQAPTVDSFTFWQERNYLILVFWLSVLSDMFVFYRMSEDIRKQHLIRSLSYEEKSQKEDFPHNWRELVRAKDKFKIDVSGGYTPETLKAVEEAYQLADKLNHEYVAPLHLFYSILATPQVGAIFARLNVEPEPLLEKLKTQILNLKSGEERTRLSRAIKEVLINSYLSAVSLGQKKVTPKNLIITCMQYDPVISEILYDFGIDQDKIFNVILWFIINERQVEAYTKYKQMARFKPSTNMNRAYTSVATPLLSRLGYDLTIAAKWGKLEFCVARENEIQEIWRHLEGGAAGILLVGPSGVGKSAIIDGIAQLMVKEDVPPMFKDKRLVELDAARLISGASPADAEARLQQVIDEVSRAGNIVLFIDNVENLIGISAGEEQSLDLSEVLSGAIERRQIYCFGAVTDENYVKYVEKLSLGRSMARIDVAEPTGNQAIQIIESKIGYFEGKFKVYFSYHAIESVIELSAKYMHDKYLPDKAIEILEMVAVRTSREKGEQAIVTDDDIAAVVSELTKIPVTKITESESEKLLNLEDEIHKRMVNQEEAVRLVSASLRRARTQMREETRPMASFLFLGPTGVGKTELAKTVAEVYFGSESYMVRIDMSEYQHPDSVQKMIGDAQGAKGVLTEAVRRLPFTLVLLDEIEKAHPNILNLFLQVMDDGRLTDGEGRTTSFTNTIIIATSNIGAVFIQDEIFKGTPVNEIKTAIINDHLNTVLRPEMINRFDGIVVFEPLSLSQVADITELMLRKIAKMLKAKGVGFETSRGGIEKLAREGYDPKFGARPLRRLLQDKVEDVIANKILAKELKRRDTVVIDDDAEINVEKGRKL